MQQEVIDISSDQLSKLHFEQTINSGKDIRETVVKKLQASVNRPLKKRQASKITFETDRGIFQVCSPIISFSKDFMTVKGGYTIPICSVIKVV